MKVTEVTAFHRVSALIFFEMLIRPPTQYVSNLTKVGSLSTFTLPALPLLRELP